MIIIIHIIIMLIIIIVIIIIVIVVVVVVIVVLPTVRFVVSGPFRSIWSSGGSVTARNGTTLAGDENLRILN